RPLLQGPSRRKSALPSADEPTRWSDSLILPVIITTIATALGMLVYEAIKTFSFPRLTAWESHTITIAFTTALAAGVGFLVLRKQRALSDGAHPHPPERSPAVSP